MLNGKLLFVAFLLCSTSVLADTYYLRGTGGSGTGFLDKLNTSTGAVTATWTSSASGDTATYTIQLAEETTINAVQQNISLWCDKSASAGGDQVNVNWVVYDCGTTNDCSSPEQTICTGGTQLDCDNGLSVPLEETGTCTPGASGTIEANEYLGIILTSSTNKAPQPVVSYNSSGFDSYIQIDSTVAGAPAWLNVSNIVTTSPTLVNQYSLFTINATIKCVGGTCGTINATARYNLSSSLPITLINTTLGDIPLYIISVAGNPNITGDWRFEEGTGVLAADSSPSGYDLDGVSTPGWSTNGKIGGGTNFTNTSLEYWTRAPGDLYPGIGEAFSINVWIKPRNLPQLNSQLFFVSKAANPTLNYGRYHMSVRSDATFAYLAHDSTGTERSAFTGAYATLDVWSMVTITYNGANRMQIYHNGTYQDFDTITSYRDDGAANFTIGGPSIPSGGLYFNGSLDEITYWNTNLTPEQITDLYNNGVGKRAGGGAASNELTSGTSLGDGDEWNASWTINYTGALGSAYLVDVLFNSTTEPTVIANDTIDRIIRNDSGGAPDPCVYPGSGDWNIDLSSNCVITSTQDVGTNTLNMTGTGSFTIASGGRVSAGNLAFTPETLSGLNVFAVLIGGSIEVIV